MANTLILKKSGVLGKAPITSDLQLGEIAINYKDGYLFYRDNETSPAVHKINAGDADTVDGFHHDQSLLTTASPTFDKIRLSSTTDASLSSTDHAFQVGASNTDNLIIDNNEIIARSNGAAGTLYFQNDGGDVRIGANGGTARLYVQDGTAGAPSITFNNDTNTGIFRDAADVLRITTGGSWRGLFNSSGITSSLNVYTATSGEFRNYSGTWKATTGTTGNGFQFINTVDGTAVTISSTGRINASEHILAASNVYANGADGFVFGTSTAEGEKVYRSGNDIRLHAGGSDVLTVDGDNSRVGIGTTTPDVLLHVAGDPNSVGVLGRFYGSTDYGALLQFHRGASYNWLAGIGGASASAGVPSSYFGIVENSNTPRLVIAHTTGNVGIGTTTPSEKLNINGGNLRFDGNGSGQGIIASSNGTNQTFSLTRQDGVNTGDLSISGYGGVGITGNRNTSPATSGYFLYVNSAGNVGINDTTPSYRLDVNGTLRATSAAYFNNDVSITNNLTLTGAHKPTFTTPDDTVYTPDNNWVTATPFNAAWHDLIAFDRNYTTTQEISTDGTNFSSDTLELGLFAQQDKTKYEVIGNGERAVRWTWTGVAYNTGEYFHIAAGYSSTTPTCTVKIETSADGSTWTEIHSSSGITFSATNRFYYVNPAVGNGGNNYVRLTIDKGNTDTKTVNLTSIKMLSQRLGDQGKGREDELPFYYDKNQNIGIGTASPNANLHVYNTGNGEIEVERASGALINIQAQSAKGVIGTDTNHTLSLKTNASERLVILNTGNVGIGTTSPSAKLNVIGSSTIGWSNLANSYILVGTTTAGIGIDTNEIAVKGESLYIGTIDANTDIVFRAGSSATRAIIDGSNGYFGIGTASPSQELHVKGEVRAEDGGSSAFADLKASQLYASGAYDVIVGSNNPLHFRTSDTRRMTILGGGNVGIGTTSPSTKLHVGDGTADDVLRVNYNASTEYLDIHGYGIVFDRGYSYLNPAADNSRTLSIGTASARWGTLDIYGSTTNLYGNFSVSGNLTVNGTTTTVNSTTVTVDDKNIELGSVATPTDTTADGGGITLKGATDKTINWLNSSDAWTFSDRIAIPYGSETVPSLTFSSDTDTGIYGASTFVRIVVGGVWKASIASNGITSNGFVKTGGTSSQFLKANGDVDSNTYLTTSSAASTYLPLSGGSLTGTLDFNSITGRAITITGDSNLDNADASIYLGNSTSSYGWDLKYIGTGSGVNNRFDIVSTNAGSPVTALSILQDGKVGIGTTTPSYDLEVNGGIRAGGKVTYIKSYSSGLDTTGQAVAGLNTGSNGESAMFEFTCFGGTGGYQKVVWSMYNVGGSWYNSKVIDEGTNHFDVTFTSNTFTFKARSTTQSYTPRVIVEASGDNIDNSYA